MSQDADLNAWLEAERDWKLESIADRQRAQAPRLSELAGGLEVRVSVARGGAPIPRPSD